MAVLNSILAASLLEATSGYVRPNRSIGSIIPDVTVEEVHEDNLAITQHPVEKSAVITDHAYKEPATVRIRCGFAPAGSSSASGPVGAIISGAQALINTFSASQSNGLQNLYQKFLTYQSLATLLTVVTGKRTYQNMLVKSVGVTTDLDHENALMVSVLLQEVILVSTQTVTVPDNSVQQFPQQTGNVPNTGAQMPIVNPANYNASGSP